MCFFVDSSVLFSENTPVDVQYNSEGVSLLLPRLHIGKNIILIIISARERGKMNTTINIIKQNKDCKSEQA